MFAVTRGDELIGFLSYCRPTLPSIGGVAFVLTSGEEIVVGRSAWASGIFRVVEVRGA